ncbi:MAG: ATP-binding cassette domain-containing protein, partial [Nitrospinaceae bacterium]|nr:ATP-binding cassette domain-containing protein [Nitrospinaceae bacterium]
MLELEDVSKTYGGVSAAGPLSIKIEPGKTSILIGQSGCGKSTLLRLMMGLIEPDTGHVLLDGERIGQENSLILRRKMGYVIQDGGLFPHLTARDNVVLMARYL